MMPDWISIKERLPEWGQEVLILLQGGARTLAKLDGNEAQRSQPLWVDRHAVRYALACVTHWLPVPVAEA